jgi:hypothetical protein
MTEEISIEVEGKHISGHFVVRDGMVTVTAPDGRTTSSARKRSQRRFYFNCTGMRRPPQTSERRRTSFAGPTRLPLNRPSPPDSTRPPPDLLSLRFVRPISV